MREITLPDKRMIDLMEYAVKNDLAPGESEYWRMIGFPRTSLTQVKRGMQSFRVQHIINACLLTGASSDWILGIDNNMFKTAQKPTIEVLRQVVAEMEGRTPKMKRWQEQSLFANNNVHA